MFRQIKEMKAMLEGAPNPAQPMGPQSWRLAATQAVRQAQADGTRTGYAEAGYAQAGVDDEPIAGVSLEHGSLLRRTVMITGMRQIAMVNFDLLFEFDLTVLPDGMPAYPATTQQLVGQQDMRRLVPGLTLEATVDLANSAAIWLDLGSLR